MHMCVFSAVTYLRGNFAQIGKYSKKICGVGSIIVAVVERGSEWRPKTSPHTANAMAARLAHDAKAAPNAAGS